MQFLPPFHGLQQRASHAMEPGRTLRRLAKMQEVFPIGAGIHCLRVCWGTGEEGGGCYYLILFSCLHPGISAMCCSRGGWGSRESLERDSVPLLSYRT